MSFSVNAENRILTQDIDEPSVSLQILYFVFQFNMSNILTVFLQADDSAGEATSWIFIHRFEIWEVYCEI